MFGGVGLRGRSPLNECGANEDPCPDRLRYAEGVSPPLLIATLACTPPTSPDVGLGIVVNRNGGVFDIDVGIEGRSEPHLS